MQSRRSNELSDLPFAYLPTACAAPPARTRETVFVCGPLIRKFRISRSTERIDEDRCISRRSSACCIHHLFDRVELHEDPELCASIPRQFPRIDEDLVPQRELR